MVDDGEDDIKNHTQTHTNTYTHTKSAVRAQSTSGTNSTKMSGAINAIYVRRQGFISIEYSPYDRGVKKGSIASLT